jgi:fructosamine-3-kinase
MIPQSLLPVFEKATGAPIINAIRVGGGSINETARIETANGIYFVKWNSATKYPGMFEAEAKGLGLLAGNSGFVIPQVIEQGTTENISFLLLEFLEPGYTNWKTAGKTLAKMHRHTSSAFGLDHHNYIGSLVQRNTEHATWRDFFSNERILPQVKLAVGQQRLDKNDLAAAERFCARIGELFPSEKPALLHGDLWTGNFLFTAKGPSIYDPAVYYGHREMDLAMTKLFGGFDAEFYAAYHEEFPLEKSWEKRTRYCNLYPLLVHVNLFGGGYANEARSILSAF